MKFKITLIIGIVVTSAAYAQNSIDAVTKLQNAQDTYPVVNTMREAFNKESAADTIRLSDTSSPLPEFLNVHVDRIEEQKEVSDSLPKSPQASCEGTTELMKKRKISQSLNP